MTRTSRPDFALRLKISGEFTVRARVTFLDGTTLQLARYLSLRA